MIRRPKNALLTLAAVAFLAAACGTTPTSAPALTDPTRDRHRGAHVDRERQERPSRRRRRRRGDGRPADRWRRRDTARPDRDDRERRHRLRQAGGQGDLRGRGRPHRQRRDHRRRRQDLRQDDADRAALRGIRGRRGLCRSGARRRPDRQPRRLLLKPGVDLVKGDDVACGSKQCYTVSADLTADDLGATGALTGLPVDLTGATLKLTIRVEKDLPYHLAGVNAVLSHAERHGADLDVTASKWDEPVTISAPPADQVKPAS